MSDLRDRISAAAQELYLSDGIEGVSMRKVADRVGVSAPAIYRHFENKDALLNEIVVEGLKILLGYLEPALQAETPFDRLKQMIENYLAFALEQPKYFDFAFLTPSREIGPVADEISRPDWQTFRMAIDQVGACMEQGIFVSDDPLEAGITLWAGAHGLIILFRTGRFGQDVELFRGIYHVSIERLLKGMMVPAEEAPRGTESHG